MGSGRRPAPGHCTAAETLWGAPEDSPTVVREATEVPLTKAFMQEAAQPMPRDRVAIGQ